MDNEQNVMVTDAMPAVEAEAASTPLTERKPPILAIMCAAVALVLSFSASYNYTTYIFSAVMFEEIDAYILTYLAGAYVVPTAVICIVLGILLYKKNLSALCGIGSILCMIMPLAYCISHIASWDTDFLDVDAFIWLALDACQLLPLAVMALGCFLNKTKVGRVLRIIAGILLIMLLFFSAMYLISDYIESIFDELTSYSPDMESVFIVLTEGSEYFNNEVWFGYSLWMYLALMLFPSAVKKA